MAAIYLALLHYPVYNKRYDIITTTITSLDLHDIARASLTYGVRRYYVINPLQSQQEMVERMVKYWVSEFGSQYNPTRKEAFSVIKGLPHLSSAVKEIGEQEGAPPLQVVTDARSRAWSISYPALRKRIKEEKRPFLLLFGTGWGLSEQVLQQGDYFLEPIQGVAHYNHLSVRSAVAIILDRLLSESAYGTDSPECFARE